MFKESKTTRLSIPGWRAVFRSEIHPGVLSFIAVHDTNRGTSLGGCRITKYASESQALTDALRLSRGMTYKNAIANLPLGGGKAVILCDPKVKGKTRTTILREFGKFVAWVNHDQDIYYTAEDMNTTVEDMHVVKKYCDHTFGLSVDPSPYTADGTFTAIEFAVAFFAMDLFDGDQSLKNKRILVQGIGKVGVTLLEMLDNAGAQLLISDIKQAHIEQALKKHPGARVVAPDEYLDHKVDVFVPCARGEVVKIADIDRVKFKMLCGAANNQLQNAATGHLLHERGIVYCPDYVSNMGGVCSIQYLERDKLNKKQTLRKIRTTVRKMLGTTFRTAFKKRIPFNTAVDHVVEQMVWGSSLEGMEYSNRKIFPLTFISELSDTD
jgi:leucine dehydrogenase